MWMYLFLLVVLFVAWKKFRSMLRIDGITRRHVFITGCDSGFGLLLAKSLDKLGVHVYAGCLKDESVINLQEQCSSKLKAIRVDITKSEDVIKAAEFVEDDLNGKALWALVNNAGITKPVIPFEWSTKEDFQQVFKVNVFGTVDTTLKFLPLIKRGKEGRIVNVTSINGRFTTFCSPYTSSKYAAEGMSDGLCFEMEPFNISVHAIEPSFYKTRLCDPVIQNRGLTDRWEKLNSAMQKSYGKSYLQAKLKNWNKVLDKGTSSKLNEVTDAITHALLAKHPQERYVVGASAKYIFFALTFTPVKFQMWVTKQIRKILKDPEPTPDGATKSD